MKKLVKYFNGDRINEEIVNNVKPLNTMDCSRGDNPASGYEFTRENGERGYVWNDNEIKIKWIIEDI